MSAIVQGQLGGGNGQLDRPGHDAQALAILLVDVFLGVKAVDLAANARRQALVSNAVIGLMPERPLLKLSQNAVAPRPIDEVTPMPVTTTRREETAMRHLRFLG